MNVVRIRPLSTGRGGPKLTSLSFDLCILQKKKKTLSVE